MVQEVFGEAHHRLNGASVVCWPAMLRRMVTCRALDTLRRRRVTIPLDTTQAVSGKDDPQAIAAGREVQARLRTSLAELAPREAEVFCLRYFEDLSYRAIAETLGISPTAASTALCQSAKAIGRTARRDRLRRDAMNATDFDAPPNREELQGLLRKAVDAIRAVPPPAVLRAGSRGQDREASDGPPVARTVDWCARQTSVLRSPSLAALARRKQVLRRLIALAAAAAVLAGVWIGWPRFIQQAPRMDAFAETLAQVRKATTITWKTTFYIHSKSKDGKKTWLETKVTEHAYKAPGLRRDVWLDAKGAAERVEITDSVRGRKLTYCPKEKKATLAEINPSEEGEGPFSHYLQKLSDLNLQWITRRKTAAGDVNVFRNAFRDQDNERDWSIDFWIDTKTKQLVDVYQPGADIYDPETDPARNAPREETAWSSQMMGGGECSISLRRGPRGSALQAATAGGLRRGDQTARPGNRERDDRLPGHRCRLQ